MIDCDSLTKEELERIWDDKTLRAVIMATWEAEPYKILDPPEGRKSFALMKRILLLKGIIKETVVNEVI